MRLQVILFISIFTFVYSCSNEAADFLLIIKAAYYLTDDQWKSIISLATKIVDSVNIGRVKEKSQLGVILYDNLNEPKYTIEIGSYGRASDLKTAIQKLKLLPCGSWCYEQRQKSDFEQISKIISVQVFTRTTKVFILTTEYIDSYSLQQLASSSGNIMLQQIVTPQSTGIVQYNQPRYNYYRAYYDQYRRYAERMRQIYPYISVQVPNDVYPFSPQLYSNFDETAYDSWSSKTCYSLLQCDQCRQKNEPNIEPSIDSKPDNIHSGDSENAGDVPIKVKQLVKNKTKETVSEDYEYEITADPPGLKINNTPLKDDVKEKSIIDDDLI